MIDNVVTSKRIKSVIKDIEYTNNGKTTICIVTLINGFQVVGSSATVDKTNFNIDVGKEFALKNAIGKIEELEGYRLQWEIFTGEKFCKK